MLRTPKERFATNTLAGNWGKIVQSEACEEAMRAAFEELCHEMPGSCPSPQESADSHQRVLGARRYMEILCSIHTPETTTKQSKAKGLDYSAGV